MKTKKVAIIGASGYSGEVLVQLLLSHPHAELVAVTSRQNAGQTLAQVFPKFASHPKSKTLRFSEPNTEVLAYTEGLVASFQFIPQAPDPAGMKPGEYPVAIFELMMAGKEYQAASPHVTKAAFERLREYCHSVLSAAQRAALVAWIDHLLTYATDKQPPLRKGEDAKNAAGVWNDFKNLGGFLRQVRKIALEK